MGRRPLWWQVWGGRGWEELQGGNGNRELYGFYVGPGLGYPLSNTLWNPNGSAAIFLCKHVPSLFFFASYGRES